MVKPHLKNKKKKKEKEIQASFAVVSQTAKVIGTEGDKGLVKRKRP